ncbi:hypothetical protein CR513_28911, partial [Mucuna pruriens]
MATWAALLRERRMKSEPLKITTGEIGVEPLVEIMIESRTGPKIVGESTEAHGLNPPHRKTIATIAGGDSMAEMSVAVRKRYSWLVLTVQERPTQRRDPPITFSNEDYEGTILHSDDPMVISVVIADYKVERDLVDQGTLIKFTGEQVEIRGVHSKGGVIRVDQRVARKCYDGSIRVTDDRRRACTMPEKARVHLLEMDPRFDQEDARP